MTVTSYTVVKPFNTRTRRLGVGEAVTAADIDHVLGAEDWRERGFLAVAASAPVSMPSHDRDDDPDA